MSVAENLEGKQAIDIKSLLEKLAIRMSLRVASIVVMYCSSPFFLIIDHFVSNELLELALEDYKDC